MRFAGRAGGAYIIERQARKMLLYIIRHGDPIYNPDSLTPKGHRQAEAVGRRLAARHFDRIYSSPLIRAQQTAQPLCEMNNTQPVIEDWASENEAWKTLSTLMPDGHRTWVFYSSPRESFMTPESLTVGDKWHTLPQFEGMECEKGFRRIQDASDEFIARQGYVREGLVYRAVRPNDERIAMFCHQGFGLTWISHLLNIPPHIMWNAFDITHTGVTIIEWRNNERGIVVPQCLTLSDTGHIYGENLPMRYNNRLEI